MDDTQGTDERVTGTDEQPRDFDPTQDGTDRTDTGSDGNGSVRNESVTGRDEQPKRRGRPKLTDEERALRSLGQSETKLRRQKVDFPGDEDVVKKPRNTRKSSEAKLETAIGQLIKMISTVLVAQRGEHWAFDDDDVKMIAEPTKDIMFASTGKLAARVRQTTINLAAPIALASAIGVVVGPRLRYEKQLAQLSGEQRATLEQQQERLRAEQNEQNTIFSEPVQENSGTAEKAHIGINAAASYYAEQGFTAS